MSGSRTGAYVLVAVAATALGVVTALQPVLGAMFVLIAVFVGLFFVVRRPILPFVALGILLVLPLDFVMPFSGALRGYTVFGIALAGAVLSLLSPSRQLREVVYSGWDVVLFAAAMVLAFGVNGISGGARQVLMLVSGILFYFWVRATRTPGVDTRRVFLRMLLVVGTIQGAVALLERVLGSAAFVSMIPGYVPALKEFTLALGGRAVALAGHPLRLGALEMSAIVASIGLGRGTTGRAKAFATVAIVLCGLGLVLSGARGAWLGTLLGVLALLLVTPGSESHKMAFRLAAGAIVGWFALNATGAADLVQQRLFGAAARPASIAQRVGVLASTFEIWERRPWLGYGFGSYLDQIYASGFRFSNTENEYVNFVLAGGAASLAAFVIMAARGFLNVWRARGSLLVPAMGGLLTAWVINIGSFNAFSWSAAFPLFMTLLALIADAHE